MEPSGLERLYRELVPGLRYEPRERAGTSCSLRVWSMEVSEGDSRTDHEPHAPLRMRCDPPGAAFEGNEIAASLRALSAGFHDLRSR